MPVSLYRPRRARASPLWQCLSEHREAFVGQYGARFERKDGWLRPEVRQTLDAFEACGDLSRGFARLHCDHCGRDYLNFHPHLHILITDGAFVNNRTFHALHRTDWDQVGELLRNRVLNFFVKKKKLSAEQAQRMRQWHHSGFGIHSGHRIQRDDHDALQNLTQYILRNPFSLEKMTYYPETGEVIYRSKRNHATKRHWETFDAPAFIAAITRHIPIPGQHLVRYYGAYSNRARGERRKRAARPSSPCAVGKSLPGCLSYADFAQKREREEHTLQAQAFEANPDVMPTPTPTRLLPRTAIVTTTSKSSSYPQMPSPVSHVKSGAS